MRLEGKIAVVTGGSRGIGRAICERFAAEGATVVVNFDPEADKGAHERAIESVISAIEAAGNKALPYAADVSSSTAVTTMIDAVVRDHGTIDIMVCNAGIFPFSKFTEISEEQWDRVHDVNLKGAFLCAQSAAHHMIKAGGGRILFTSSVSSIFGASLGAHYSPTKGGVNQLMKSIAISLGKHGITANAVLPGTVITDINYDQLEIENTELKDYFIERTPLNRLAEPNDIAAAMVFFASDDANAITGATLVVDGGMSINMQ